MKKSTASICSFVFIALIACVLYACEKDGVSTCETVIEGDYYLKVVNNIGDDVEVDLTNSIPLVAELRAGACELYGLPEGVHEIIISNGIKSHREIIMLNFSRFGYEVVVDEDYFN